MYDKIHYKKKKKTKAGLLKTKHPCVGQLQS